MDDVDEAIIDLLESDGRLTHTALARVLGIPRANAGHRLNRLLGSGRVAIRGVIHPAVLGRGHLAHVALTVRGSAHGVALTLAERPDCAFVSLTAGRHDVVAEIRAGSLAEMDRAVSALRAIEGVEGIDTVTYVEVLRDVIGPTGEVEYVVDATDVALLKALQEDGRASYVDLAQRVRLTPAGVRRRVQRLVDAQVVRVGVLARQTGRDRQALLGLGMRLDGDHRPIVDALVERSAVAFLARTLGRFDLLVTLRAHASEDLGDVLDTVRALPGVNQVESWAHLTLVKESYADAGFGSGPPWR